MKQPTVAIIGAGISGLMCSRTLAHHGWQVTVIDKGRRPGGRMSTRRSDAGLFDHGCQYLTASDTRFCRAVEEWHKAAVVKVWTGRVVELDAANAIVTEIPSSLPRYVGASGMNGVCNHLAADLAVQSNVEIQELKRTNAAWLLVDIHGKTTGPFDAVVVATPPIQAAALLREAPQLADIARSVSMSPCWTVMAAFADTIQFPADAAVVRDSALSWIARSSKCQQDRIPDCWVLQASTEWSQQHLEDAKQAVEEQMLAAFFDVTGCSKAEAFLVTSHRWRYANCARPLNTGCLIDQHLKLATCGDWCLGDSVEAAFLSGLAAADRLLGIVEG